MGRAPALRLAALLTAGTLLVHELRYVLAFGGRSDQVLAEQGHGYLSFAGPVLALLMALALAEGVLRIASAAGGGAPATQVRLRWLWPALAVSLLALYSGQELLEGAFSEGHPAGLAGVVGSGGWIAVPVSLAAGLILTLTVRVADVAERRGARLRWPAAISAPASTAVIVRHRAVLRSLLGRPMDRCAPGRAPPRAA